MGLPDFRFWGGPECFCNRAQLESRSLISPTCSVVIRAHNEERHIGRLLSGILRQTIDDVDIVVVDSGSDDATTAIASRYPVRVVSIDPQEFSFGRALNIGCSSSSGSIIVIASAHVYPVYEDWLEQLIAPLGDPEIALAYGKQRGNHRTRLSEHRVFARWFPDGPGGIQNHPFCNNANAAIRRSVWEQLPYDEDLTGLEDVDWAHRVIGLGKSIVYAPGAEVVHVHEELPLQILNRYRREAIALKQIFPHERFGIVDFLRLCTANIASDAAFAARRKFLLRNLPDIIMFRTMQFWGTYRGFAQRAPVDSGLKKTFYYPNSWRGRGDHRSRNAKQIHYGDLEDAGS